MASELPAKLKIPTIQPFVVRAAQLQKFKPIVAYWCNYHVVNQILSKGLHSADDECRDYTTELMDELETAKNQSPPVDAIVDDIAARAYIEQFALETFQRADDAIHSDKASRQTIDTFQAASTFLELLGNWGPLDPEFHAKIKYAKYHALRIAKAIKAGEDPNASNPKDDIPASDETIVSAGQSGATYLPPSVEAAADSDLPSRSASATPLPGAETIAQTSEPAAHEGMTPQAPASTADIPSEQTAGEYFPQVPTFTADAPTSAATTAPPLPTGDIVRSDPDVADIGPAQDPSTFYSQPFPPSSAPLAAATATPTFPASVPVGGAAAPAITQAPPPLIRYKDDDESVAKAQKHARWAISALNFEDAPTAVKELRLALQTLGAG